MAVTHAFVSAKADGGDATLVRPSNWNADHTIADATITTAMLTNIGPGATGPIGSATVAPVITIDAKGRVTALTSATITAITATGTPVDDQVAVWASATAIEGATTLTFSAGVLVVGTAVSIGTTPATAGAVRLANNTSVQARNSSDSGNLRAILVDASNELYIGSSTMNTKMDDAGTQHGSPTGGSKGVGTINLQNDIYKNNTAYTSPDYAFEHFYTGRIEQYMRPRPVKEGENFPDPEVHGPWDYEGLMSLNDVKAFAEAHWHLPRVPRLPTGLFERADILLEKVEELYLYLFGLDTRLERLEAARD